MTSTARTRSDNVGATDPRLGGASYYVAAAGTALIAGTAIEGGLTGTLVAATTAWAVTSLVLMPGRVRAGRGLFLAITIVLIIRNYSELTPDARFWALGSLAVLLSVFAIQPLTRTRGFPFLHVWCLVEAIYVYMSGLISTPFYSFVWVFTPDVRALGYQMLFVFNLTVVVVGIALTRAFGLNREPTVNNRRIPEAAIPRAYVLIGFGFGLVWLAERMNASAQLGSLTEALRDIGYGGILLLVMIWIQGGLKTGHKLVVVGVALAQALAGLGAGALYASAVPGFLLLALFMSYKRAVPWAMILTALLVLTILNVQKGSFRQETWNGASTASSSELGVTWLSKSADSLDATDQKAVTQSAHRFANSDILGYVAKWAPNRFSYVGYGAYTSVLLVLIPRIIYPEKGSFNEANKFGRDYELIARSDYGTTVNTPLHVEAYLAGGPSIMFAVAIFSGSFLALLGFCLRKGSNAAILTGCTVTYQVILTIESGILGFALTLPFMLFLYPLMWWASRDKTLAEVRASFRSRSPVVTNSNVELPDDG